MRSISVSNTPPKYHQNICQQGANKISPKRQKNLRAHIRFPSGACFECLTCLSFHNKIKFGNGRFGANIFENLAFVDFP